MASSRVRNQNIDTLKFIGIMCIVLAHVGAPTLIYNIRNFDVVLMVYVSALLYIKYEDVSDCKSYCQYAKKRLKKIVLPSWVAIMIILGINIFTNTYDMSLRNIIYMFGFNDGVDYLWVIRVYILLSFIAPVYKICFIKNQITTVVVTILLYVLYEVAYCVGLFNAGLISYFFVHVAPCLLITLIVVLTEKTKNNLIFLVFSFVCFMTIGIALFYLKGEIVPTDKFKFPFRLYYLSYGLFVTELLVFIQKRFSFAKNSFIVLVSKNSLWIYLSHIFFIMVINKYYPNMNWLIKYVIIVAGAVITVIIKNWLGSARNFKITDERKCRK